ncbi:MAG TPA: hypothetical protein QF873_01775 [Patescibacteria group bacterium]|nr:hypothetical protein [Patescibacteria group bacterium]
MKPLRFLLMFISASVIAFLVSSFLIFTANMLGEVRLLLAGFVLSIMVTFIFSFLYFKGVPDLSWRERMEVIAVWMGLMIIVDGIIFRFMYDGTWGDLGVFTIAGYSLSVITLFVAAYLTSSEHPTLARSPNLLDNPSPEKKAKPLNKKQA